ncbi:PilZ domain-containing protein [Qipengyuania sp. SS22]|uniref:PilZ domain-containing protein n=1 Tax=Qipengyuania sp. SS22 TaxID=2979461 RepID=UPI0021E60437|nr:PilZ domain-containing protein [Qipengyuania sp. SS22]UYH54397.1 PilZ domain-containing protein [Qipengyuania sp. SS22]
MSSVETRNVSRDSLLLFAQLTFEGRSEAIRVKVRNLSAGGMMAEESGVTASRGDRLMIELRNIGMVKGSVAWAQGNRFGVAFENEIDPKIVRAPVGSTVPAPRYTHPTTQPTTFSDEERRLRKL